ncbi:flagellar hook-associated protein FlgL [Brevibacillus thermoruber]|jgi:flagellar hook-associated protein 3 FlgL|uniref:Flagellar hook-associated protein FlgL n=1 Tax=Brevibacillus thermoruber TaxID=33942 RepID=A0A9X3Z2S1_9BACL|nr:flagellar hook-associated protein FlgL [Brevibacillus thermoruber]MDA5108076.1 flagellar hook-associated protein FlgL [Brevibacillus thermoruber]
MAVRVTQNMLNRNMLRNLYNSMGNMDKLQEQLSSGKKVSKPSDDPVIVTRGMFYRSSLIENDQFTKNTTEALNWLDATDQALDEVGNVYKRVQELVVASGNGTLSKDDLKMMAMEITELKNHLGNVANQTVNGRYIFAGTDSTKPPYDTASGQFTNKNSSLIKLEISENTYVPININAQNVFNNPAGNNIFTLLDNIVNELNNGNAATAYSDQLKQQADFVLTERAALGARVNRLELVEDRLSKSEVSITGLMSKNEDADIAEVITQLKTQENVHRAALSAGARIIQPSLVDFLR